MPITVASELRDDVDWMEEMLPIFQASCENDKGNRDISILWLSNFHSHLLLLLIGCMSEGWSILIYTTMATVGKWEKAWAGAANVSDEVFDHAGGNGHSRSNTLWYIATR